MERNWIDEYELEYNDELDQEPEIVPLTKEQADELRETLIAMSVWDMVLWQLLSTAVLVALVATLTYSWTAVFSVFYGCVVVLLPTTLFAYKTTATVVEKNAASRFMLWGVVKQILMLLLLFTVPVAFKQWLNFWLLFLGLFVTLKVYWFNLLLTRKRSVEFFKKR